MTPVACGFPEWAARHRHQSGCSRRELRAMNTATSKRVWRSLAVVLIALASMVANIVGPGVSVALAEGWEDSDYCVVLNEAGQPIPIGSGNYKTAPCGSPNTLPLGSPMPPVAGSLETTAPASTGLALWPGGTATQCGNQTCFGVGWTTMLQIADGSRATVTQVPVLDSHMDTFVPDPTTTEPPVIEYPCAIISNIGMTTGVTTISALQVVTAWSAMGRYSAQSWTNNSCAVNWDAYIYAKDGAGVLHRCTYTKVTTVYTGGSGAATNTQTGLSSGTCTGVWVVQSIRIIGRPSASTGEVGEGLSQEYAAGSPAPGTVQYRTELRCEADIGGWGISAREDLAVVKVAVCQNFTGNSAAVITPTHLDIFARVVAEDGWAKVAAFDITVAPSSATMASYPNCYSAGVMVCTVQVKVDGQACGVAGAPSQCATWTAETVLGVACWLGPYEVPLWRCNFLERYYLGLPIPAVAVNFDGNPSTFVAYVPPTTTPPPTGTSTGTGTGTATGTGTDTGTGTGGTGDPGNTGDPGEPGGSGGPTEGNPDSDGCYPSGWGVFNPIEWIVKPIKCIFQWAFIPSQDLMSGRVDQLKAKVEASGPGPIIEALGNNFTALGASGGCTGPTVEFSIGGVNQPIQPFNACSGGMATAAAYSKALSSVVIIVTGGISIARAIASAFGLSFSMGRGGGD